MSSTPDYCAEIDDPVAYEKRWLWISERSDEAKAQGCNVTRTEVEGGKLAFKGWKQPSAAPEVKGIRFDPPKETMEPYPALSPNRMYGDCLRFIYKDGKFVLQEKWIIPQEGLRVPVFEWRDVPIADATEP